MIYFIQAGNGGPIKIGYSKSPKLRLKELQTGNPDLLKVLSIIDGSIAKEKEIHKKFSQFNIKNEWFFPAKALLDYIEIVSRRFVKKEPQLSLFDIKTSSITPIIKGVAIYHCVFENETFEIAAKHLFELVRLSVRKYPKRKRYLFVDVMGHRNKAGGFDKDMFELLNHFCIGVLMKYLYRYSSPLCCVQNNNSCNRIEDELIIN